MRPLRVFVFSFPWLLSVSCTKPICGDFTLDSGEACDDGNLDNTDACIDTCSLASCGDGFVQVGVEICDDGNFVDGDGCESDCGLTQIVGIATGVSHTCALIVGGRVRCWGEGFNGQLGYGNQLDNLIPTGFGDVNVGGDVAQISLGNEHTCAILDTGAVRCWGHGTFGRLGYGNTESIGDDETPASAGDVPVF